MKIADTAGRKWPIAALAALAVCLLLIAVACSGAGAGESAPSQGEPPREATDEGAAPDGDSREEAPGEAAEEGAAELPVVPESWVSGPEEFDTEEDRQRYEAGEWHTDGELQGKYGLRCVTTDEGVEYTAGELLLYPPEDVSEEDMVALAANFGATVAEDRTSSLTGIRRVLLVFPDNTDMEEAVAEVDGLADVSAELNYVYGAMEGYATTDAGASDPYSSRQKYLSASSFDNAWEAVRCEGNAVVAVLDTGVDGDHPDLGANIDFDRAYDVITGDELGKSFSDENGHGTIVSGIISAVAGNGSGIAGASSNAVIVPVRVLDGNGKGNVSLTVSGLEYLASLGGGIDVVNMSLGGEGGALELQEAINALSVTLNIVCVASAGNESTYGDTGSTDPLVYPAACDNVIAVGSVGSGLNRSDFSRVNSSVDICAMGEATFSTTDPAAYLGRGALYDDEYVAASGKPESLSGTSFAAPQVSAAAALLAVQHPEWGPMQIEERLEATARDLGDAGRDDLYGYGLLDAAEAVGWAPAPEPDPAPAGDGLPAEVPADANRNVQSNFDSSFKPVRELPVAGYVNGAATRAAEPAVEILGMASVEECGTFVNTETWYDWAKPKYWLDASWYNCLASPYLANLATGLGDEDARAALVSRTGAGPNASLAEDSPVWSRDPDVVVGTGEGDSWYGDRGAEGVEYAFTNYQGLIGTMGDIAVAADTQANDGAGALRFGSAGQISQLYERYIWGTTGRVLQALDEGTVPEKSVVLVQGATYSVRDRTWYFDVMTTDEAMSQDGTASQNRYMETLLNTGVQRDGETAALAHNLGDDFPVSSAVTASQLLLAEPDLILVGGNQGAAGYADIMDAMTGLGALGRTYFVKDNGTYGAQYGVVMNSVENAQNMGRILGMLYPEYESGAAAGRPLVSQRAWLAYYYQQFYHIDPTNATLKLVMANALDGVRNASVADPADADAAAEWTTSDSGYPSGFGAQEVYDALNAGYEYWQAQQPC